MKKTFLTFILAGALIVMPVSVSAQANLAVTNHNLIEIVTSLLKRVMLLEQRIVQLEKGGSVSKKVEVVTQSDYQKKVKPLLEKLENKEDELEILEQEIEQKQCGRAQWKFFDGKRTFKCYDTATSTPKVSAAITELQNDAKDIKKAITLLEDQIEKLKDQYGI